MAILYVPSHVKLEREQQLRDDEEREKDRVRRMNNPSPYEMRCRAVADAMRSGNEKAGILAKQLATESYDNYLDRNFCMITGSHYFHSCEDW